MDLSEFSEDIIKRAIKRGCDVAEVYIKGSTGITVEAKEQRVDTLKGSKDFIIALRVIKGKRLGFSFTTDIKDIEKTIDGAIESAEWTAGDDFNDIPEPANPSRVEILDDDIKALKEEDIIKDALLLEEAALSYDKRIKRVRKATVSSGLAKTVIANSKGVNVLYEGTYVSAYIITFADDGNDSQTGWDFLTSRTRRGFDLANVGRNASMRAIELLGSRRINSVKVPVILDNTIATEFLGILSTLLSAESVQKNKSMLKDKVGKPIASPLVEVIDDGTMPWAVGTRPVDDEGTPTSQKTLISDGILHGFIHNTYTAKKDNVKSTGNAIRRSLQSIPGVGTLNLYIKPAECSADRFRDGALLKSLNKGILVTSVMGMHTANPISGDFSVGISGIWIENGEPLYPIKEAVMSGNILELLRKVKAIGNDLRFYGDTGSPSLLIDEMDISA